MRLVSSADVILPGIDQLGAGVSEGEPAIVLNARSGVRISAVRDSGTRTGDRSRRAAPPWLSYGAPRSDASCVGDQGFRWIYAAGP